MCYHKSLTAKYEQLAEYYSTSYSKVVEELYSIRYHENGFDFLAGPVVTAGKPGDIQMFHCGLVPFWVKDAAAATRIKVSTLNCISEEMYDKPAFRDAAGDGKRCLIPCSGFFEWRWMDEKGKKKIPYFIQLKDQPIFSIAGLYSRWVDRSTDGRYYSYTCWHYANRSTIRRWKHALFQRESLQKMKRRTYPKCWTFRTTKS